MQKKLQPPKVQSNVFHFWDKYFYMVQQVTTQQFLDKFKQYLKEYGDYELSEQQFLNIRNVIDPTMVGTVDIREFNIFYEKFWNEPASRRNLLQSEIPLSHKFTPDPMVFQKLTITAEKVPKNASISEGYNQTLIEIDIEELKTLKKFDLTFGKEGCDVILVKKDDPFYENEMFRISRTMDGTGFKVKCTARNARLKFRVGEKPYFLIPGMIIQIGRDNLFHVTYVNPYPTKTYKDYYSLIEFHKADFIEESKRKLYRDVLEMRTNYSEFVQDKFLEVKDGEEKIRLECIAGPNKGDIIDFVYKVVLKGLVYRIGRAKYDTDYQIDDITVSNVHCSFGFDKNGWYIYEEKPTVFGTHIFLPNYEQWKNQHSSFSHVLEDGMKLCVEDFIFNCSVKPQIRAGSEELYERYKASMARMQQE